MGASDQCTWYLPGPGPIQPRPFRQGQRAALVELHGAYPGAMDPPDQGLAGLDAACPFRTIQPSTRLSSQAADRLARQGALQLCRWLPGRRIIFIGNSSFAVHELAHAIARRATLISRLRLDASLFAPPAKRTSRTMGRPAQKGPALPKLKTLLPNPATNWTRIVVSAWYGHADGKALEITSGIALWYRPGTPVLPVRWVLVRDPDAKRDPQAFFSTDVSLEPTDIIALFVRRWQIEVTFAETRAHLGVETQRQWTDNAITRTTPALLGLYSLVSLWAGDLLTSSSIPYAAAWYRKASLTFSDAIGAVRLQLWVGDINQHSPPNREP
jgi:hypothetical protein